LNKQVFLRIFFRSTRRK